MTSIPLYHPDSRSCAQIEIDNECNCWWDALHCSLVPSRMKYQDQFFKNLDDLVKEFHGYWIVYRDNIVLHKGTLGESRRFSFHYHNFDTILEYVEPFDCYMKRMFANELVVLD